MTADEVKRFSPLRYWGSLYQYPLTVPVSPFVLVPFDIGVVYITINLHSFAAFSFSPLRYWGSLYQILKTVHLDIRFSPLRYWGSLYPEIYGNLKIFLVLVPFDIGVVYIFKKDLMDYLNGFSPLRYWGSLYPII